MNLGETKVYNGDEFESALIENTIAEVAQILEERGYNPINQIVGYLMSGDPGYISSHKEARKKILQYDQAKILEVMVRKFLSK
ncbi:MAG: IreB family regulatory phosphoprotein [Bacilli bacterium]|nr:IreB family regulatory phosphoprotein [Bacilli bacterium]